MKRLAPILFLTLLFPSCGDDESTTAGTALPTTVTYTPPATVPPRPVPTPVPDSPPTQVIKFNPTSASGSVPFLFKVNQCFSSSSLPGYPLHFNYDYGDGTTKGGGGACRNQHTYQRSGVFRGTFCVNDGVPGHGVCTHKTIVVS